MIGTDHHIEAEQVNQLRSSKEGVRFEKIKDNNNIFENSDNGRVGRIFESTIKQQNLMSKTQTITMS